MPHLTAPKEAAQEQLRARLAKLSARQRREIEEAAGFPPNLSRVPETMWRRHEEEIEDELAAVLLLLWVTAGGNLFSLSGRPYDDETLARRGETWASRRASETATGFVENTRKRLTTVVKRTTTETTTREYREELDSVFSESRAETVATTETRAAVTEGEKSAADEINRDGKDTTKPDATLVLTAYWIHDDPNPPAGHAGASVDPCKICTPLLGKKVSETPFPEGPPCHARCDCSFEWRDQDGRIIAGRDDTDGPTLDRLPAVMQGRKPPRAVARVRRPERTYQRQRR